MTKRIIIFASTSGLLAVAIGAMGAHALKDVLDEKSKTIYETAVKYQMYHTFALLLVVALWDKLNEKKLIWSARLFVTGIILFSGSLYFLALRPAMGVVGMNGVGAITPFGGLSFMAGWLMFALAAFTPDPSPTGRGEN